MSTHKLRTFYHIDRIIKKGLTLTKILKDILLKLKQQSG